MEQHKVLDLKPPQEIDAEESILASILLDHENRDKVFEALTREDFYSTANRIVFEKCSELKNNGSAIETADIYSALSVDEKKYVKADFLYNLTDRVPVAVNIEDYIKRIKDAAKYRRAIELCNAVAKSAEKSDSEAVTKLTRQLVNETEEPKKSLSEQKDNDSLFPYQVLTGAAGYFADVHSECIEAPIQFLFMAYLTGLGATISSRLTIRSMLRTQPRLFTVLLGGSATERKSTAVGTVINHFKSVLKKDFNACWGIGSAEGLQKVLKKKDELEQKPIGTLLAFDELKAFVSKCNIDSSVLLPIVNTLFESNIYESHTKKSDIAIDDAYLSLLAASTLKNTVPKRS